MLVNASIESCVLASQKHEARVAKHNTFLKLPSSCLHQLPETWLPKDFRVGRHMWNVFGQVFQALQCTLGHLNTRV